MPANTPPTVSPPSSNWVGNEHFPPGEAAFLRRFLDRLNLDALCSHANTIRNRDDCTVRRDVFARGQESAVLELHFGDNTFWVAKLRLPPRPGIEYFSRKGIAEMESEIVTMHYVKKHTSIPVPEVQGFNLDSGNSVGAEYMFMDALPGRLIVGLPQIPNEVKPKVYAQVVDIILQLSRLRMPFIGLLCRSENETHISGMIIEDYYRFKECSTATEFCLERARIYYQCKLSGGNKDHIVLAWLYEQAIAYFVQPESDNGPFPLRHPDLNNCNILYDEDYNITGVIDWTATYASPWESFLTPPIEFRLPQFTADRQLFFDIFEDAVDATEEKLPITKFMNSDAGRIAALVNNYHFYHPSTMPDKAMEELIFLMFGSGTDWTGVKQMYRDYLSHSK
jgi:hypothetical protein